MTPLDQLTDRDLSEVFAVEVAGWKRGKSIKGSPAIWPPDCDPPTKRRKGGWPHGISVGDSFATSADAVLPFLDQCSHVKLERFRDGWWGYVSTPSFGKCDGPTTFARAACIALIEAKRAEGGR
jgi:hypothetical protein